MRNKAVLAVIAAVLLGGLALLVWWPEAPPPEEAPRRETEDVWAGVREESARLVPDAIAGVRLGMTREEIHRLRPAVRPDTRTGAEPGLVLEREDLANGARAFYAFEASNARLQRIQLSSILGSTAEISPRLHAMNERYGAPSGVWDCPDTGGVPTRRFTWRAAHTTVSDVFLIYGGRVSATLYVAPTEVIERSLSISGCRPLESREALDLFPVASPEQMGAAR
jgi:hypothetical protein